MATIILWSTKRQWKIPFERRKEIAVQLREGWINTKAPGCTRKCSGCYGCPANNSDTPTCPKQVEAILQEWEREEAKKGSK